MLFEIRRMGFEQTELSHGIKISLLEGIQAALKANEIRVTSLHNFCPLPLGVMHAAPNCYLLSSTDKREWEKAINQTKRTIEFAVTCGAKVVVMHLGKVPMRKYSQKLFKLYSKGKQMTPKYERVRHKASVKRETKKQPYWKQTLLALDKLVEDAKQAGIRFGVENRLLLEEIPTEAELAELLNRYDDTFLGYWHDTGHAHIREMLGVSTHEQMLELAGPRLLGFHIHDVDAYAEDHRPPGYGDLAFERLKPFVRPDTIKVFEFSPKWRSEDVAAGVAHLKGIWTE